MPVRVREVVVRRRIAELVELLLGPADGVFKDEPGDHLRAGRRRQRSRVGVELVGVVGREQVEELDGALRRAGGVGPVRDAAVAEAAAIVARIRESHGVEDGRVGRVVGAVAVAFDEGAQDEEADAAFRFVEIPGDGVVGVSPARVEEDHVHFGRSRRAADGVLGAFRGVFAPVEVELREDVLVVGAVGAAHFAGPVAEGGAGLAVVDVVAADVHLDGVAVVLDEEEGAGVLPAVAEVDVGVVPRLEADVDRFGVLGFEVDGGLAPLGRSGASGEALVVPLHRVDPAEPAALVGVVPVEEGRVAPAALRASGLGFDAGRRVGVFVVAFREALARGFLAPEDLAPVADGLGLAEVVKEGNRFEDLDVVVAVVADFLPVAALLGGGEGGDEDEAEEHLWPQVVAFVRHQVML
mmetsp:Transcript_26282/g.85039  ORF Transcript_26282/g.85039 Transcript_26282/m.85039 type:complete len:410 (+) Transcript_26282:4194-5423(+)